MLYYDKQRHSLTDDRTAVVLTQNEELVVAHLATRDMIQADQICRAVWGSTSPDAHNSLRTTLAYLRSKCARVGIAEPARHIGKSGIIRSSIIARSRTPERCRCCGQPLPDNAPEPVYVRRAPRGVK